jgi:VIT1/CCC1 family predicted Fe2+/Mn2+ transporter
MLAQESNPYPHPRRRLREVPAWRDWVNNALLVSGGAFIGAAIPLAILIMTPSGVVASSTRSGSIAGIVLVGTGAVIGASWVIEGLFDARRERLRDRGGR